MGWEISATVKIANGVKVRTHQCVKGNRRLTYTITTKDGSDAVSLGPPKCELLQPDGTWLEMTWREWAGGAQDKDYPFPFPSV